MVFAGKARLLIGIAVTGAAIVLADRRAPIAKATIPRKRIASAARARPRTTIAPVGISAMVVAMLMCCSCHQAPSPTNERMGDGRHHESEAPSSHRANHVSSVALLQWVPETPRAIPANAKTAPDG